MLLLLACNFENDLRSGNKPAPEDTATLNFDDSGQAPVPPATLSGTVEIAFYEFDELGNRIAKEWPAELTWFPCGRIYVGAYEGSNVAYIGDVVIQDPSPGSSPFSMEIKLQEAHTIGTYAVLDYNGDGIISQSEPVGLGPSEITIEPGSSTTDIKIIIDAAWDDSFLTQVGHAGNGGGNGQVVIPDETEGSDGVILGGAGESFGSNLHITGNVLLNQAYTGGTVRVMMYGVDGSGPLESDRVGMTGDSESATGAYQLRVSPDYGPVDILAAWDSNANNIIDPGDVWGEAAENATSINPVTIGSEDIANLDVYLPLGSSPNIVPFISITGQVESTSDYSTWNAIYIAAMKSRPVADMSVDALEDSYDTFTLSGSELASNPAQFALVVPTNAYIYLLAAADVDGDGILLEADEPSVMHNNGTAFSTENDNLSGLVMALNAMAPPN